MFEVFFLPKTRLCYFMKVCVILFRGSHIYATKQNLKECAIIHTGLHQLLFQCSFRVKKAFGMQFYYFVEFLN